MSISISFLASSIFFVSFHSSIMKHGFYYQIKTTTKSILYTPTLKKKIFNPHFPFCNETSLHQFTLLMNHNSFGTIYVLKYLLNFFHHHILCTSKTLNFLNYFSINYNFCIFLPLRWANTKMVWVLVYLYKLNKEKGKNWNNGCVE
jgi:hypothetical protein